MPPQTIVPRNHNNEIGPFLAPAPRSPSKAKKGCEAFVYDELFTLGWNQTKNCDEIDWLINFI